MADTTTLIVPVRLAALCVGTPDAQMAHGHAPMADFARLPFTDGGVVHNRGPYVSTGVLAHAGPFEGAVSLPRGIHLHWSLPAGLSHAVQEEAGGPMVWPTVPNRWLVTRIVVTTATGQPITTSWVVESDRLSADPTAVAGLAQPTVPVAATPGRNHRYLGAAYPLPSWNEVGGAVERLAPLTAVGYGEPTFAAYYPNCSTVFGFVDTLDDLPGFSPASQLVSYQVAGWYADPASDPLAAGDAAPGENPFGWTWDGGATPTATLCSGFLGGIPWNPAATFLGGSPSAMTAALAASPQEALAALMADALATAYPDQDFTNAEALLNALQFGLLSRPASPDALEEFEETVHAAGFASLAGGSLWTVVSVDDAPGGDDGAGAEATLSAEQGAMLDSLNALQLQWNDLALELQSRRHQLFVDWHKYLVTGYTPPVAPPTLRTRLTDVRAYLEAELAGIAEIAGAGGAADALRQRIDDASASLAASLDPSLRLVGDSPAPRYHGAVDPVLVLAGGDVVPRGDAAAAEAAGGLLPCRVDAEMVTSVVLPAGLVPDSVETTVTAAVLPGLTGWPSGAPTDLLMAALRDQYFYADALQPVLAWSASHLGPGRNPALLDFAGTVAALRTAAAAFLAGEPTGVVYGGEAPAPRLAGAWAGTPWLPLVLEYDAAFGPVQPVTPAEGLPPYDEGFILDGFGFDGDEIDLVYGGPAPAHLQSYTGAVVLSAGAATDLAGSLRRWLAGTGSDDPRVAEALAAVETMPLLAQGMGGMGEAMRMRRQTLQMGVADPLAPRPVQPFVADVAGAVGGESAVSPLPQVSFNPIRTGTLAVDRLRLVDAFGRFRDYAPRVLVARGLAPPPGLSLPPGTAFLPPRITQPSRLLFRWISAAGQDESTAAPATSPVFGWVLPNYLDRALAIYDAGGTPLGALGLSADGASVLWSVAPGGAWPLGTPLATVMAGQEPHLAAFAAALYAGGAAYFAPFFDAVRQALAFALPERFREDVGTAVLLGQPLALARASLALSLAGPAATDESWTSFTAAVLGGPEPDGAPWDGGLTRVRFPVRLGAPAKLGDTLVGFWTEPGGTTDYGRFYAPAAAAWSGPVGPPDDATVALAPRAESAPAASVTMLLDPRGQVHATTGILPVAAVSIPPSQYADALRALAVAFSAGPVLSGSNLPGEDGAARPMSLVRPRVAAGAWSWVTVAGGAWARTELVDAPSAAGTLSYSPQHVSDGWMVLTVPDPSPSS
jgi:hypothetical protein